MADFKSTIISDKYGNEAECTMLDQLKVASNFRLCGGVFNDSILDSNFYTGTTATGGTNAVVSGVLTSTVTTSSGSTANVITNKPGRYVGTNSNYFRGNVKLGDTGIANNVRIWGAVGDTTPSRGAYFKLDGTTLYVCHKFTGSAEVAIPSGSFNGRVASYTPDTNCHTYEIYYTVRRIIFSIDGVHIHTFTAGSTGLVGELHLYAAILNTNTGAAASGGVICSQALTISRSGERFSSPTYKNITTATTTLCKTGPGTLQSIILNNPGGTITLYDNTSGAGTTIGAIAATGLSVPTTIPYGVEFIAGLTIVTSASCNITVVYE